MTPEHAKRYDPEVANALYEARDRINDALRAIGAPVEGGVSIFSGGSPTPPPPAH